MSLPMEQQLAEFNKFSKNQQWFLVGGMLIEEITDGAFSTQKVVLDPITEEGFATFFKDKIQPVPVKSEVPTRASSLLDEKKGL